MTNTFRQLKKRLPFDRFVLFMGSLLILCACQSENYFEDVPASSNCNLVITLKAPVRDSSSRERTGETRAGTNIPDEDAVKNLTLSIVTDDNSIFPVASKYIGRKDGTYQYEATLSIAEKYVKYIAEDKKYILTARLVAVANMPDELETHPFGPTQFPLSYIVDSGLIPLWGVTSVDALPLQAGVTIDAGLEIEMLRAVPKFTFILDSSIKDKYNISEISTSHKDFEQFAVCQPMGSQKVNATASLSEEERFNPAPIDSEKGGVQAVFGLGTGEATVYTGERECRRLDGQPLYFKVVLSPKDNPDQKILGKIFLCDYPDNKTPDLSTSFDRIVRNHDYQYNISLAELSLVVSFHEWKYGGKVHVDLE